MFFNKWRINITITVLNSYYVICRDKAIILHKRNSLNKQFNKYEFNN